MTPDYPLTEILPTAVRAATTTAPVVGHPGYPGVMIILYVTANPGGGQTLSVDIRSSNGVTLYSLGVLVTAANGTFIGVLTGGGGTATDYNGASIVAGAVKQVRAPSEYIVRVVHSGAGNWTYQAWILPLC